MPCRSPQAGSSRRLAVGKPSSRPRLSPWITCRTRTRESRASSAASSTRPPASAVADRAGRHRAAVVLERRHDIDGEAVLAALRRQEIRRAGAVRAEMEIEADRRAADGEPLDQDALDEFLGASGRRAPRRRCSTIAPSSPVEASSRSLAASSVSRNSGSSGRKKAARMRLEGQRRRRPAERLGAPLRRARSPPGGRDARRRNCRWRRPRRAAPSSGASSRTTRKRFAASGFDWLRRTCAGRRCRWPGAKSSTRHRDAAAGDRRTVAINR